MNDRTSNFLTRVDAYLKMLPDDAERRSFLAQQIAGWEFRYERFQLTHGASEPITDSANPPQAADFLLTIMTLHSRRKALTQAHACPYHATVLPRSPAAGQNPAQLEAAE
jgi:hypothetical protein